MKFKTLLLMILLMLCALPVLAQDTPNSVSYNGFSFSFAPAVAGSVNIYQYPGDPADLQQPGGPVVKNTEFVLYNGTTAPQNDFDGAGYVQVYNTADFAGYDFATQQYQALQTLLAQRPDLSAYMTVGSDGSVKDLPYLPVPNAAQAAIARAHYVDSSTIQGVAYVTIFRQDVSPFLGDQFRYTFQGLSSDGVHYVAATFNLTTTLFPAQMPANFDEAAFDAQFSKYVQDSINTLNNAQPTDFTPSLTDLDALFQSFSFTGSAIPAVPSTPATVTPTPTQGDPTMGGLAGVTWTLVSYGDPANPTAALPTPPVTLMVSSAGIGGSGGCNSYSGSFQYNAGTLTIGPLITTLMACADPAVNTQEQSYLAALQSATSYQINGDQLQITYDGGVLTYTSSSGAADLAGVTWTLVSYGDPANPTAALPTPPVTLTVSSTGVSGNGGCNSYSGDVHFESGTLTIGPLLHTMMACADQAGNDQESAYLSALQSATSYQVTGNQLQITYDGGVLTFTSS